jgi:hypothetical protein
MNFGYIFLLYRHISAFSFFKKNNKINRQVKFLEISLGNNRKYSRGTYELTYYTKHG